MISLITKLTHLEKCFVSPKLVFAQIYKLHSYGQYKMEGIVINVPTNINQMQLLLSCLPYDDATIGVFLKWELEYKSFYMFLKVHPNLVMLALKDLVSTPLYSI